MVLCQPTLQGPKHALHDSTEMPHSRNMQDIQHDQQCTSSCDQPSVECSVDAYGRPDLLTAGLDQEEGVANATSHLMCVYTL